MEPQKPTEQPADNPVSQPPTVPPTPSAGPAEPEVAPAIPAQPAEQPAVAPSPTPVSATQPVIADGGKRKLSKLLLVLAAVFLLAAAGVGAWYLTQNGDETAPVNNQSQTENQSEQTVDQPAEVNLKKVTFPEGGAWPVRIAFDYPEDWVINTDDGELAGEFISVGSPSGHFLRIQTRENLDEFCDANSDSYTLVKKLSTQTPGRYFTQYQYDGLKSDILLFEDIERDSISESHKQLGEGSSGTDTCNIPMEEYAAGGVFVALYDTGTFDTQGAKRLGWDDIKDDTEFVKMLQSLEVVDKPSN